MFFFFFQAEDGIRDLTVTGVQTCALPICGGDGDRPRRVGGDHLDLHPLDRLSEAAAVAVTGLEDLAECILVPRGRDPEVHRSEERRVGKECRSRWSPYH